MNDVATGIARADNRVRFPSHACVHSYTNYPTMHLKLCVQNCQALVYR